MHRFKKIDRECTINFGDDHTSFHASKGKKKEKKRMMTLLDQIKMNFNKSLILEISSYTSYLV